MKIQSFPLSIDLEEEFDIKVPDVSQHAPNRVVRASQNGFETHVGSPIMAIFPSATMPQTGFVTSAVETVGLSGTGLDRDIETYPYVANITTGQFFQDNHDYFILGSQYGYSYKAFIGFDNITVAQGDTIVSAYLVFEVSEIFGDYSALKVRVGLNNADDASFPSSYSSAVSKIITSAKTTFSGTDSQMSGISAGSVIEVDVTNSVQEVVNRTSWASGNRMMVIGYNIGGEGNIFFSGYSNATYDEPFLSITYA